MYATVQDLRAEGVPESRADDKRLVDLIDDATHAIDRVTGWFFDPRPMSLLLDGRGTATVEPGVPPIRVDRIAVDGQRLSLAAEDVHIVGAPVSAAFAGARVTLRDGRVFPKGRGNVEVAGIFGFTEADGTAMGRTPGDIRRACMLLCLRWLDPLADDNSHDARNRWRILNERTRDQSYTLDRVARSTLLSGDPEIDRILLNYRRPIQLGAA